MHAVAIDIGYGNVKLAYGEPNNTPKVSHWIASALPASRLGYDIYGEPRQPDITLDGEPWYVGVESYDDIAVPNPIGRDYIGSAPWRAHLLLGLQRATAPDQEGDEKKPVDRLVLGLPVDDHQDKAFRQHTADTARSIASQAGHEIGHIRVMPQPMGGYVFANMIFSGAFVPLTVIMLDAGYNTLDWTLVRNGKIEPLGSSSSRSGGVMDVCLAVQRVLETREDVTVSEDQVRWAVKNGGLFHTFEGLVNRSALIDEVAATIAADAMAEVRRSVRQALKKSGGVAELILTGGGSVYYRPWVKKSFPKANGRIVNDGITANVRGMWFFGAHRE